MNSSRSISGMNALVGVIFLIGIYPVFHYKILNFGNASLFGKDVSYLAMATVSTEFIIAFILGKRLFRERYSFSSLAMFVAFFSLCIAESIYGVGIFQPDFLSQAATYVCYGLFTVSTAFFLSYLVATNSSEFKSRVFTLSLFILILLLFAGNWFFILKQALDILPTTFYKVNSLTYALLSCALTAVAILLFVHENGWMRFMFLSGILVQSVSDFAIRFNEIQPQFSISGFEYGWQISISLMAFAVVQRSFTKAEVRERSWLSLRVGIALMSAFAVIVIFSYLLIIRVIQLDDAFLAAHFVLAILLTFVLANAIAAYASNKAWTAIEFIESSRSLDSETPEIDGSRVSIPYVHQKTTVLELDKFIVEYNTLSLYTQSMLLRLTEMSRLAAIAATTQMLAHDVRKPFSLLKTGMSLLRTTKSESEMNEVISLIEASVGKSIASVNGMLEDIMEIGHSNEIVTESVNIESVLEHCLLELFQVYERARIDISFDLAHKTNIDVNELKIHRVFSNILGNGIQAMKNQGSLLIATQPIEENGRSFIQITLGNSGPIIPQDSLGKLFEMFFTSGKQGGTGLGLAIAKKLVMGHGGRIWCESPGQRVPVEFSFTLPITHEISGRPPPSLPLPATSAEARDRLKLKVASSEHAYENPLLSEDPLEAAIVSDILRSSASRHQPIKIVVVDDEPIYRNVITRLIGNSDELSHKVEIVSFSSGNEALIHIENHPVDAVICDIDLGHNSCDGYEVIRKLRNHNFLGTLCVHSNRCLPDDFKRAMDAGADLIFPKPMGRVHLLRILLAAANKEN